MVTRRTFVAWVAGAVPVALVTRQADALGAAWIAGEPETLRALSEAVLPSELGTAGAARVALGFQAWIDNYAERAELVHGYGTAALRFSRPSPRAAWAAQLERIGQRITDSGQRKFAAMSVEERRAVVRDELQNERIDRMPSVGSASHVALALLAYYYGSSEAADLCYASQIGRTMCRPLAAASRKPPLASTPGARR